MPEFQRIPPELCELREEWQFLRTDDCLAELEEAVVAIRHALRRRDPEAGKACAMLQDALPDVQDSMAVLVRIPAVIRRSAPPKKVKKICSLSASPTQSSDGR